MGTQGISQEAASTLASLEGALGACNDNLPDLLDGTFTVAQVSEEVRLRDALAYLVANGRSLAAYL